MAPASNKAGFIVKLTAAAILLATCQSQPTGIVIAVDTAEFEPDELQFGVRVSPPDDGATGQVVVDPEGKGRVKHMKKAKHERQPVFLDDDLAGQALTCEVIGLVGGKIVAAGVSTARPRLHEWTEVQVTLAAAGPDYHPGRRPGIDAGDQPSVDASDAPDADAAADAIGPLPGSGGSGGSPPVAGTGGRAGGTGGTAGGTGGRSGGTGGAAGGTGGKAGTGGAVGGTGGRAGTGGAGGSMPPPLKGKGAACRSGGECATNFCVDGVCCGTACTGGCRSCNDARGRGDCLLTGARAADPRHSCAVQPPSTCATNGTCDGNGACARYPASASCGAPSCKNKNFVIPGAACDGNGQCQELPMVKCDNALTCVNGACI
ncbi:MAG TPA: hypothetical protein VNO55_07880 [Polyangia bacterium]|nr:hypothetical protein [Polyangia bacterium]